MLFSLLFESPQSFLMIILAIIYALTVHEFSHSAAATYLGDMTSKFQGRLTLNPIAHMEIFGTLMLLFAGFGWGKPVPVNPYNLRWKRFGELFVALAGPISNFLSVVLFIIVFNIVAPAVGSNNLLFEFLQYLIFINMVLGVFNLIPIPPLDGSKVLFSLLPAGTEEFKRRFSINGPIILIILILADNFLGINIFGHIFSWFAGLVEFFL